MALLSTLKIIGLLISDNSLFNLLNLNLTLDNVHCGRNWCIGFSAGNLFHLIFQITAINLLSK